MPSVTLPGLGTPALPTRSGSLWGSHCAGAGGIAASLSGDGTQQACLFRFLASLQHSSSQEGNKTLWNEEGPVTSYLTRVGRLSFWTAPAQRLGD